jgi:hypothetical protein
LCLLAMGFLVLTLRTLQWWLASDMRPLKNPASPVGKAPTVIEKRTLKDSAHGPARHRIHHRLRRELTNAAPNSSMPASPVLFPLRLWCNVSRALYATRLQCTLSSSSSCPRHAGLGIPSSQLTPLPPYSSSSQGLEELLLLLGHTNPPTPSPSPPITF